MSRTRMPNIADYQTNHKNDWLVEGEVYGLCSIRGVEKFDDINNSQLANESYFEISKNLKPIPNHDSITGTVLQKFNEFDSLIITSALENTVTSLQQQYGKHLDFATTLTSLIAWKNPDTNQLHGYTTQLGNGIAYFVIVKKSGKIDVQQLNESQPEKAIGPSVQFNQKAQIQTHTIQLEDGDQAFGVVVNHGFSQLKTEFIEKIFRENQNQSPAIIAEKLVDIAYQNKRSNENITVGVANLESTPISLVLTSGIASDVQIDLLFENTPEKIGESLSDYHKKIANLSKEINNEFTSGLITFTYSYKNLKDIGIDPEKDEVQNKNGKNELNTDQVKLDNLINAFGALQNDYIKLGRTTHIKDIRILHKQIFDINSNVDYTSKEKYEKIIAQLEKAFMKEQEKFCKPFLGIGRRRTPQQFIDRINSKQSEYHYPRLLATTLKAIYIQEPGLTKLHKPIFNLVNDVKLAEDKIGIYSSRIPRLLNEEQMNQFNYLKNQINDIPSLNKLSAIQLYQIYTEPLNENMVKKIWPELKAYGYDDQALSSFIDPEQEIKYPDSLEGNIEKIKNSRLMNVRAKFVLDRIDKNIVDEKSNAINSQFSIENIESKINAIKQCVDIIHQFKSEFGLKHDALNKHFHLK